ncbi:hypothetical protein [Roseobacter sp.]|uniref:hypothetical protein n=1 Tax=Roseobacter sp. TaxID=1907202 RepID=UPI0032967D1D
MTLSRIIATAAMTLLASTVTAEWALNTVCDDPPNGTQYCVPVVGCFDDSNNVTFIGRATGAGAPNGLIYGRTNQGIVCEGNWVSNTDLGFGRASFACEDGRQGHLTYTSVDPSTGTTFGSGVTEDGVQIRVWSGRAIDQFVMTDNGDLDTRLMCNGIPIPLS